MSALGRIRRSRSKLTQPPIGPVSPSGSDEDHVPEQLGAGPEGVLGRLGRQAADQQHLAVHAAFGHGSPRSIRASADGNQLADWPRERLRRDHRRRRAQRAGGRDAAGARRAARGGAGEARSARRRGRVGGTIRRASTCGCRATRTWSVCSRANCWQSLGVDVELRRRRVASYPPNDAPEVYALTERVARAVAPTLLEPLRSRDEMRALVGDAPPGRRSSSGRCPSCSSGWSPTT